MSFIKTTSIDWEHWQIEPELKNLSQILDRRYPDLTPEEQFEEVLSSPLYESYTLAQVYEHAFLENRKNYLLRVNVENENFEGLYINSHRSELCNCYFASSRLALHVSIDRTLNHSRYCLHFLNQKDLKSHKFYTHCPDSLKGFSDYQLIEYFDYHWFSSLLDESLRKKLTGLELEQAPIYFITPLYLLDKTPDSLFMCFEYHIKKYDI